MRRKVCSPFRGGRLARVKLHTKMPASPVAPHTEVCGTHLQTAGAPAPRVDPDI